jgi:hypothetical protein
MAENTKDQKEPAKETFGARDRLWIPRFWDGMNISGWFSVLVRNRFVISPSCIAMAVIIAVLSVTNSFLWALQQLFLGRKIESTKIEHAPIFIIGHWRSGTTLLHELLVLDSRHTYPDTYDCFAPNHFLISAWWLKRCFGFLLPSRRPMDNMAAGWDRPQEDEFALCNMGLRSPYLSIIFPNHPPQDQEYFDFEGVSPEETSRWKQGLLWFLKCITYRAGKRIILKSPPHTARIKVLLELFPNARFVHIVRDPYVLFPSTVNLWQRLNADQGLQVDRQEGMEDHVFETFERMYRAYDRDRQLIDPSRFHEVRYEDLVKDPVGELNAVYEALQLEKFDDLRPALEEYAQQHKDYKTNRYEITPEIKEQITQRWGFYAKRHGY